MGKTGKMVYYGIIIVLVIAYVVWLASDSRAASGFGLNLTYVLGVLAVLGTLVSSVLYIANNPKNAKKLIIGVCVLAVICGVSYIASSGEVLDSYAKYDVTTVAKSKLIDMGMYLTSVLGVGSVVLAVVTEAVSLFKN